MVFAEIHGWLTLLADTLWGWPMLIILLGTGLMLTVKLRGIQVRWLGTALKDTFGAEAGDGGHGQGMISNRSALWTALAATVGTGNIAGVATAIALGGPGAVFWMWMSGLFGMAIKYSEAMLGVHYRVQQQEADGSAVFRGGPMYYLTHGVKSPVLGMVFAVFLALAAVSTGGMVQSNSTADALKSGFGFSPTLVGLVMTLTAGVVMFGGLKWIAKVADWLVPLKISVYALTGLAVLGLNYALVPGLIGQIFKDAFTGTAASGGFAGAALVMAMRYGLARGVFANESGLGSAPIVAATAKTVHPVEQGLISMTQTFIDTFVVCTFTALVILVSGAWLSPQAQSAGAALTNLAFNTGLGNFALAGVPVGSTVVSVCLTLFSFTAMLGWGYYGQQGAVYVLGPKATKPYIVVFLACTLFGAAVLDLASSVASGVKLVWTIADILIALMMLPNLYALWRLRAQVVGLTNDYLAERFGGQQGYRLKAFFFDVSSYAPNGASQDQPAAGDLLRREKGTKKVAAVKKVTKKKPLVKKSR